MTFVNDQNDTDSHKQNDGKSEAVSRKRSIMTQNLVERIEIQIFIFDITTEII